MKVVDLINLMKDDDHIVFFDKDKDEEYSFKEAKFSILSREIMAMEIRVSDPCLLVYI